MIGGSAGRWVNGLGRVFQARALSPFVGQRLLPFLTRWSKQDLHWRRRAWMPALTNAGFAYFRPYDLRHTCATLLIYEGRTVNEVARHLGHADPGFTARTYAHVYEDAEDRRRVAIETAILRARVRAVFGEKPSTLRHKPRPKLKLPANRRKADARIRTADPVITRVDRTWQPVPSSSGQTEPRLSGLRRGAAPGRAATGCAASSSAKTADSEGQRERQAAVSSAEAGRRARRSHRYQPGRDCTVLRRSESRRETHASRQTAAE